MKKKSKKESREFKVLLGVIDLYLKLGKPIGSNTLRECGFEDLSSATIRNYFAELETQGYLKQPHSSGGRIPTQEAFKLYAQEVIGDTHVEPEDEEKFQELKKVETRNTNLFLHHATELLSEATGYATFLSSVRFDHDLILDLRLVGIDSQRILCVLITEFGQIYTEVLNSDHKLSSFAIKRIENYLQWRLKGKQEEEKPLELVSEEELLAKKFYNEIMVRYLVRYSNYSDEDIHRTGFSRLLTYPEFSDPLALATGLSLFENASHMRLLLNDCIRAGDLQYWIGNDLAPYAAATSSCTVVAIPYRINQLPVGAVGILGPCRMPYRSIFGALRLFSESISQALTKSLYTFKLSYRQPRSGGPSFLPQEKMIMDQTTPKLLEIKE